MYAAPVINLDVAPCQESPELALWRGVLRLAITDYRGQLFALSRHEKPHAQRRAQEWIFSTCTDPGSFLWVCELLDVNPQVVVSRL